jgi:hypothetical protein
MGWIDVSQDRDKWWHLTNTVMKFCWGRLQLGDDFLCCAAWN